MLAAFSRLWAAATLFHLASFHGSPAVWPLGLPLLLAALALLQRPTSGRLLLLTMLQLSDVVIRAPLVSNHWLLTAFVGLALLHCWVSLALGERTLTVPADRLFGLFAPVARLQVIAFYLWSAMHKFNTDFLLPESSCGPALYAAQADRFSLPPDGPLTRTLVIYLVLAVEVAIPVLLMRKATRRAGISLGAAFHTLVGLNPWGAFYNFSALLIALLFLFEPAGLLEVWRRLRTRIQDGLNPRGGPGRLALLAALLAASLAWLLPAYGPDARVGIWLLYGGIWTLVAGLSLRAKPAPADRIFRPGQPLLMTLPLLVFLNGASPYLGLKTETSFSMYSNLRTEGGKNNHLLLPASLQVFDYQRDLVSIASSSEPYLEARSRRGEVIPWLGLRSFLRDRPRARVSFLRGGRRYDLERVEDDPALSEPIPYLAYKLLRFRPLDPSGPQACRH